MLYLSERELCVYKKDVTINWLDWFLTKGDAIIVAKFHFEVISKWPIQSFSLIYARSSWAD